MGREGLRPARSGKIDASEWKMLRGKLEGLNVARRRFYAGKR